MLKEAGVGFSFGEVFWSRSVAGSVRGIHFQEPPAAIAKLVWCTYGIVIDVVLDLRRASNTYGCAFATPLGDHGVAGVVVPVGCAHGFGVQVGDAAVCCATSGP